ncbi:MAG: Hsp20/alpha crystallin family protein [Acidimicrobiales bacterium]
MSKESQGSTIEKNDRAPTADKTEIDVRDPGSTSSGLDEWFDHWPASLGRWMPDTFRRTIANIDSMRMEQFRDDDELVLRAELPGMLDEDDIDVSVSGNTLTIHGTREEREEERTEAGYRSEFRYGTFRRSTTLPTGADTNRVRAEYENGILEVRVPIDDDDPKLTKVPVMYKH